jgi:hypothetical protein
VFVTERVVMCFDFAEVSTYALCAAGVYVEGVCD